LFIELNMNMPQYQTVNIDVTSFANTAQRHGIFYTIHLDENLNPCDFNPLVAKAYLDTYENSMLVFRDTCEKAIAGS